MSDFKHLGCSKPWALVGQINDAGLFTMIALGTDAGPIVGPFWLPKSDQIGPKRAPKSIKKVIEKLVEFRIDFETIFGHF